MSFVVHCQIDSSKFTSHSIYNEDQGASMSLDLLEVPVIWFDYTADWYMNDSIMRASIYHTQKGRNTWSIEGVESCNYSNVPSPQEKRHSFFDTTVIFTQHSAHLPRRRSCGATSVNCCLSSRAVFFAGVNSCSINHKIVTFMLTLT